jgi:branched-chain amino acid transport system substrate-binding protein
MRRIKIMSLSLSLLLFVSIILPCFFVRPVVAQTPEPIKIGIFIPITEGLTTYGPWTRQGFELGMVYATTMMGYNNENKTQAGRPYELHYYDTHGDPVIAASAAVSAIETDGIDILVGGTSSAVAGALEPIAEEYEKVYFITPGAASSLTESGFNPYIFRLARNSWHDAYAGVTYAMDYLNYTRFAFLAANYAFGYAGVDAMAAVIAEKGGTVLGSVYANLGDTDFSQEIDALQTIDSVNDIQYLFVIWAGDFSVMYADFATYNIAADMEIAGACIDILSMNFFPYPVNATGLCLYGYDLPNNAVNDWMVAQHVSRNIYPDLPLYTFRVPELFTAAGFATAQFLVNVTNAIPDLDTDLMINHLESGLTINTPKGPEYLRPEDHQGLAEMYIATSWNDTRIGSETYHRIIAKLNQTLDRNAVAPPVASVWNGEPYVPGGFAPVSTTTTTTTTTTGVVQGFDILTVSAVGVIGVVLGFIVAAVIFRKK